MLAGFVGSILPALPGTPVILAAAIGHRLYFGQHSINNTVLIVLIVMTFISVVFDYVATAYGAKRFGATWRGAVGAALGGIVGIFFAFPGVIIGPFLGAMICELMGGYKADKAARAGLGAMLGLFVGAIGKGVICMIMIGLFTVNV